VSNREDPDLGGSVDEDQSEWKPLQSSGPDDLAPDHGDGRSRLGHLTDAAQRPLELIVELMPESALPPLVIAKLALGVAIREWMELDRLRATPALAGRLLLQPSKVGDHFLTRTPGLPRFRRIRKAPFDLGLPLRGQTPDVGIVVEIVVAHRLDKVVCEPDAIGGRQFESTFTDFTTRPSHGEMLTHDLEPCDADRHLPVGGPSFSSTASSKTEIATLQDLRKTKAGRTDGKSTVELTGSQRSS